MSWMSTGDVSLCDILLSHRGPQAPTARPTLQILGLFNHEQKKIEDNWKITQVVLALQQLPPLGAAAESYTT